MYVRKYETITIVNPTSDAAGVDKVLGRMREAIDKTGGKEVRLEDWGVRRLAYKLSKQSKGRYLYMKYLGSNATVAELERLLRITEESMKWQTIVLDERVIEADFDFDEEAKAPTIFHEKLSAQEAARAVAAAQAEAERAERAAEEDENSDDDGDDDDDSEGDE